MTIKRYAGFRSEDVQPAYVKPAEILHPVVICGFAFLRPITLVCGWCGRTVTRFSFFGRVRCECGTVNCPEWR